MPADVCSPRSTRSSDRFRRTSPCLPVRPIGLCAAIVLSVRARRIAAARFIRSPERSLGQIHRANDRRRLGRARRWRCWRFVYAASTIRACSFWFGGRRSLRWCLPYRRRDAVSGNRVSLPVYNSVADSRPTRVQNSALAVAVLAGYGTVCDRAWPRAGTPGRGVFRSRRASSTIAGVRVRAVLSAGRPQSALAGSSRSTTRPWPRVTASPFAEWRVWDGRSANRELSAGSRFCCCGRLSLSRCRAAFLFTIGAVVLDLGCFRMVGSPGVGRRQTWSAFARAALDRNVCKLRSAFAIWNTRIDWLPGRDRVARSLRLIPNLLYVDTVDGRLYSLRPATARRCSASPITARRLALPRSMAMPRLVSSVSASRPRPPMHDTVTACAAVSALEDSASFRWRRPAERTVLRVQAFRTCLRHSQQIASYYYRI